MRGRGSGSGSDSQSPAESKNEGSSDASTSGSPSSKNSKVKHSKGPPKKVKRRLTKKYTSKKECKACRGMHRAHTCERARGRGNSASSAASRKAALKLKG